MKRRWNEARGGREGSKSKVNEKERKKKKQRDKKWDGPLERGPRVIANLLAVPLAHSGR